MDGFTGTYSQPKTNGGARALGGEAQGCVESERRRRSEQGAEGVGYPLFHPSGRVGRGIPLPPLIFFDFSL